MDAAAPWRVFPRIFTAVGKKKLKNSTCMDYNHSRKIFRIGKPDYFRNSSAHRRGR